jgi:secreted trypsin-like serine protease
VIIVKSVEKYKDYIEKEEVSLKSLKRRKEGRRRRSERDGVREVKKGE